MRLHKDRILYSCFRWALSLSVMISPYSEEGSFTTIYLVLSVFRILTFILPFRKKKNKQKEKQAKRKISEKFSCKKICYYLCQNVYIESIYYQRNLHKLEKIKMRFNKRISKARYLSNYERLKLFKLLSIKTERRKHGLTQVYKIINYIRVVNMALWLTC